MFDIAPTELLLVALVALVVIGPKDLPRAMRVVGGWVARARGVARHFRSGIDEMMRQSELEEMEKKWAAENERILREHPATTYTERVDDEPAEDIAAGSAFEPVPDHSGPKMTPLPAPAPDLPRSDLPPEAGKPA